MYRAEAIISKKKLIHNYNYIRNYISKDIAIMPVVKANAYGHDDVYICKVLSELNVDGFCVALLDEVINLRKNKINKKILHMGSFEHKFTKILIDPNLLLTINLNKDIEFLEKIGKKYNHIFKAHIKIDTGMVRLGILEKDISKLCELLSECKYVKIDGIYTQLTSADESNQKHTDLQREKFIDISSFVEKKIGKIKYKHITPSAGMLKDKKNHFDLVRPGISLYGISNVQEPHSLKPVMMLKAPVLLIKNIKKSTTIGYNKTFKSSKNMKIAILQIGYADAIPLEFSNKGYVEYKNRKLNILGKVSMDLLCVDVSDININKNEKVIVFGGELTKLEDITKNMISSPYSILTNITKRVKRIYEN